MNKEVRIRIGGVISRNNQMFRVVGIQHEIIALCELNINKVNLIYKRMTDLENDLLEEKVNFLDKEDGPVINISALPDASREKYQTSLKIIHEIRDEYGPMYEKIKHDRTNHLINKLSEKYGYQNNVIWRLIRVWLQSGMDDTSLVDRRSLRYLTDDYINVDGKIRKAHKGNKQRFSDKDLENVSKYFKEFVSNKYTSMKDAYLDMCNDCYRTREIKDDTEIISSISNDAPSYQQFIRYCNNHLTTAQRDAIVMKAREQRNNKRILKSSSMTGVSYAGETAEIDEVDNQVSLVSVANPSVTVGRPNTYLMIDVKSRVILAIGVAFNQNSYVGLTNMMINLAEDKVEYCKKYGIDITEDEWPSGIIPAKIRTDRGSDFKGKDFLKVCQKIGIERNLEPPATGSMKGLVENSFRTIQPQERSAYQGIGQITKDYGSKHHENAMLNINEYTRNLILLVIKHNKRSMDNYPLTPDMIAKGIQPRPIDLWKYFSETVQAPLPIPNKKSYLVALMKEGKATVNRSGVHFLHRTYFPPDNDAELYNMMYTQQSKSRRIDIRYDPRNMNHVYLLRNNNLIVLTMSKNKPENDGYFDLSEQEIVELNKNAAALRKKGKDYNRQLDADTRITELKGIEASYKDLKPSANNLREHRKVEKSAVADENYSIGDRLGVDRVSPDSNLESDNKSLEIEESELKKPAPKYVKHEESEDDMLDSFMDAIGGVNSKS